MKFTEGTRVRISDSRGLDAAWVGLTATVIGETSGGVSTMIRLEEGQKRPDSHSDVGTFVWPTDALEAIERFASGTRVRISEISSNLNAAWIGLTAVVVDGRGNAQIRIRLDDGLVRPDGESSPEFYWYAENLEKIEVITEPITPETYEALKTSYEARVADLEGQVRSLNDYLIAARGERDLNEQALEDFKKQVHDVAMEYAVEHDWCGTVAQALLELGIEMKRTVTIQVTATAEVTVPYGVGCSIESSVDWMKMRLDSDYDYQEIDFDDISVVDISE